MEKIKMTTPLVEMDGDKCATITPNAQRMDEYKLHEMWKSPNGTIRAVLDGTVFRAPIMIDCIKPAVRSWKKPITIARHAYGDVYKCTEFRVPGPGRAELRFTGEDGSKQEAVIYDFECPGVLQGSYNKDSSIASFARSCFAYALDAKQDLWFGAKDTISKKYDHTFKAMMTSVLVSPDGKYEYEAAHGTVTRHYYRWLKGEKTSTNPMATIFAWSGALKKRGELDDLPDLVAFGEALEAASLQTLNDGIMTKDLCALAEGVTPTAVDSEAFIQAIRQRLEAKLGA